MRRRILLSLVIVIFVQSWMGGFWSVRSVTAERLATEPVVPATRSCCTPNKHAEGTMPSGHKGLPAKSTPCQCPDRGDDCCCLRALAVNGGFVFSNNVAPTIQLPREIPFHIHTAAITPARILFLEEEKIAAALPPVFKLKACFLI